MAAASSRPLAIAVGHGHDLGALRQLVDQQTAAVADADHAHANAVVGAHRAARQKVGESRGGRQAGFGEHASAITLSLMDYSSSVSFGQVLE